MKDDHSRKVCCLPDDHEDEEGPEQTTTAESAETTTDKSGETTPAGPEQTTHAEPEQGTTAGPEQITTTEPEQVTTTEPEPEKTTPKPDNGNENGSNGNGAEDDKDATISLYYQNNIAFQCPARTREIQRPEGLTALEWLSTATTRYIALSFTI